uniref:Uncharacterized protein n=1 Tax=Arundo donax TaxID=35708 RepID=A0A0A9G4R5_ARUDO
MDAQWSCFPVSVARILEQALIAVAKDTSSGVIPYSFIILSIRIASSSSSLCASPTIRAFQDTMSLLGMRLNSAFAMSIAPSFEYISSVALATNKFASMRFLIVIQCICLPKPRESKLMHAPRTLTNVKSSASRSSLLI